MRLRRELFRSAVALTATVCAVSIAASQEFATATPEATVQTLHRGLIEAARGQVADLEQRHQALQPLIVATHDLPYIAEFAIRRQWRELSVEDRQRFTSAFEKLSVMTYASRFKGVGEETFSVTGTALTDAGRAQITAAIKRAGAPDLPLEYLLHERAGSWKIINIIADGVSDLALKRAEYQRILAAGSIADLIAHLEAQTARFQ